MPAFETMDRHQRAVYWPAEGKDKFNQTVIGEPEDVWVRWVWQSKTTRGSDGTPISSDAQVVLNFEAAMFSHMWLAPSSETSAIDQWYGVGSAGDTAMVMEVVDLPTTPDIKNRNTRYNASLAFFRSDKGEVSG